MRTFHAVGTTRTPRVPTRIGMLVASAMSAALAAFGCPAAHADDAETQALRQQVEQLQQKIDDLAARQQTEPSSAQTGIAPGSTVAAALGSATSTPSFFAGPVKMTLSGFVELMLIDRNRNEADDWASNFNTAIPYPNSHNYELSEFHLTERQSRIAALAEGPSDANRATEAYVETDFGGSTTNGNNNQSSSFSPRVRHFYADYRSLSGGWYLLFGQTWSLVTAEKSGMLPRQENIPLTIDGQYVPGFDWLRVPQVRLVKNLGDAFRIGISAENPAVQVAAGTTAPASANLDNNSYYSTAGASNAYASTTNVTTDYVPDLVAKAVGDPGWGHYEIFSLTRWFRSRYIAAGEQGNQVTRAYGVGASTLLPLLPKRLEFQASFLAGTGIGRYGSTGEPDATVNPVTGALAPLHGYHVLSGLILHPGSTWTVFVYGGIEHVGNRSYDVEAGPSGSAVVYGYGYGNPLFSNSGCETEGVGSCTANTAAIRSATLGAWWKFYEGTLGNMQLGATDTYLRRSIFAGLGGNPSTDMNVALVSFRYYPYQL